MTDDIPSCPGPDPTPQVPDFEVPAGACDTHAHVFGPESRYPYSPKRGYTPPDASPTAFAQLHATLGIERAVLTQPSVYGTDNRAMLDAIALRPDTMRGVAAVNDEIADRELETLNDQGIRGIRVNMVDKGGMPFASIAEFVKFAERLKPLGWHIEVLIHVDEFPDLRETLGQLPVNVVVGHLGYMKTAQGIEHPGFQEFLSLLRDGNCWVKLTGTYRITGRDAPPYDDVTPFARALNEAAPDRLLWGTDWPHPWHYKTMPNDGYLLGQLVDWGFNAADRERILVSNPTALYGF